MVSYTTHQNLPYTATGDPLNSGWSTARSLGNAVDSRIQQHTVDQARVMQPPMAVVVNSAPYTITLYNATLGNSTYNASLRFDTVLEDTTGGQIADLGSNNISLTLPSQGVWTMGWYARLGTMGCAVNTGIMWAHANGGVFGMNGTNFPQTRRELSTGNNFLSGEFTNFFSQPSQVPSIYMQVNGTTCGTTAVVQQCRMWAYKVADYP